MQTSLRQNQIDAGSHENAVLPSFLALLQFLMQGLFPGEQHIGSLLDHIEGTS
jgi:hypothetical protein